jgi:hypothetical protein
VYAPVPGIDCKELTDAQLTMAPRCGGRPDSL